MLPFPIVYGSLSNHSNRVDGGFAQVEGGTSMEKMINSGISTLSSRATVAAAAEAKAVAASKSHSEAERRRRERINGHLATLRTLLPNITKTDKATLLAGVVQHVKDLKKLADDVAEEMGSRSCREWSLPGETDELTLDYCDEEAKLIKASLCCEDQPELLRNLTTALRSVEAKVTVVKAEIGTIGGRTKSVIVVKRRSSSEEGKAEDLLVELRRALKGVVDKSVLSVPAQKLPEKKRPRLSGSSPT